MRKVHGEYPFDKDGPWQGIWKYLLQAVPKGVVEAFLAEVPPAGPDDRGELPNKGFRVVRCEYSAAGGVVIAVYNHDGEYHLIQAEEDYFNRLDERRWPHAGKGWEYQPPAERLPFPSL